MKIIRNSHFSTHKYSFMEQSQVRSFTYIYGYFYTICRAELWENLALTKPNTVTVWIFTETVCCPVLESNISTPPPQCTFNNTGLILSAAQTFQHSSKDNCDRGLSVTLQSILESASSPSGSLHPPGPRFFLKQAKLPPTSRPLHSLLLFAFTRLSAIPSLG